MAWTKLTSQTANNLGTNTQLTVLSASAVKVGDTIFVAVTPGQDAGGTPASAVVTDDLGNVYTNRARTNDGTNHQLLEIWRSVVTVAGTPTVRVQYNPTPGTTTATNCSMNVDPFTGSDANSVDDGGNGQNQAAPGTGTDAVSSANYSPTPVMAGSLSYGACVDTQTGADPGAHGTGFTDASVSGGVVLRTEYKVLASAGTAAATFTATTGTDRFITAGAALTPLTAYASITNVTAPGASPGVPPESGRFQPSNWWPYSTIISGDLSLALTGVSSALAVGTVGVSHTNTLTGVSETSAVGSVKASLSKALTGVSSVTGRGTLGVSRSKAIAGVSSTTSVGTLKANTTVGLTGVGLTGSVGTVTPTTGIVVALSGVQSALAVGSLTPSTARALSGIAATGLAGNVTVSGAETVEGPVSKFRYIIKSKGRQHKSSHREIDELLDRVFSPPESVAPLPSPVIAQVQEIVQPFIVRDEINLSRLYKSLEATEALLAVWQAEMRTRADRDDDDDVMMLS